MTVIQNYARIAVIHSYSQFQDSKVIYDNRKPMIFSAEYFRPDINQQNFGKKHKEDEE